MGSRVPEPHSSLRHPDSGRPYSSIMAHHLHTPEAVDTIPSPSFHKSLQYGRYFHYQCKYGNKHLKNIPGIAHTRSRGNAGAVLDSSLLWCCQQYPLQRMERETLLANGFHAGEGDWACSDDALNSFFLHCVNHKADNNISQPLNKLSFWMY